jgi:hypothetical protein
MLSGSELEEFIQKMRTVSNKQVELFDRLRQTEERLETVMERVRKCEDRTGALEREFARRPSRL